MLNLCSRNKTGILGWRSEKMETVHGYEAKVKPELLSAYFLEKRAPSETADVP